MAEDLIQTLTRFRYDVASDVQRIIDEKFEGEFVPFREEMRSFRNDTLANFDAIYKKLDRLETEYHALCAAVFRLEHRMELVEKRLDSIEQAIKVEIRQEIDEIKQRIAKLQERVAELEAQL